MSFLKLIEIQNKELKNNKKIDYFGKVKKWNYNKKIKCSKEELLKLKIDCKKSKEATKNTSKKILN